MESDFQKPPHRSLLAAIRSAFPDPLWGPAGCRRLEGGKSCFRDAPRMQPIHLLPGAGEDECAEQHFPVGSARECLLESAAWNTGSNICHRVSGERVYT